MKAQVPSVEERVSAVAAGMAARLPDVTGDIVGLLTTEIPPLRDDERVVSLLSASVAENVTTLLHSLEHGIDPATIEAPAAAIEYARRLAQRGVPMIALVRAYRIGQARFLSWCFEELARDADDPDVAGEVSRRMTEVSFVYIDRISEQVIETYQEEHDRWLHNRATVRVSRVRSLLAGEDSDLDGAELTLGYRLRRRHLGLVAWTSEPLHGHDDLLVLEQVVDALAGRVGRGKPLFVPRDASTAWAWLPDPTDEARPDFISEEDVWLAFGEPADGVDGFRRTHQQALAAQVVGVAAAPSGPRVTAFADVRPIALMTADLDATRAWVQDTLGSLALDDDQQARLRTTLRVFLSTGGSYTSTAERLTLHRNTVHYRVHKAEEMLGRPIQSDRLDIELALVACDSLGSAVLRSVG